MSTEHPDFKAPENPHATIWRYMDFTKFASMLVRWGLLLVRSDKLGDPFEGAYPIANKAGRLERWERAIGRSLDGDTGKQLLWSVSQQARELRPITLVNCWHQSEHESAAMWRLYAEQGRGIAIKTTFQKLYESLPDDVYLGVVKYIDYEKETITEWNGFAPYLHKRISFAHEAEVRAIKLARKRSQEGVLEPPDLGEWVEVDLRYLLDEIRLSPDSNKEYRDLVQSLVAKFDMQTTVTTSQLDEEPFY